MLRLHRHRVGHRAAQERATQLARSTRSRRRRGSTPLRRRAPRSGRPACRRRRRRPRRRSMSSSRAGARRPRLDAAVEAGRAAAGRPAPARSRARCGPGGAASSSGDGGSGTALPSGVSLIVMCGSAKYGDGVTRSRPLAELVERVDRALQRAPAAGAAAGELRVVVGHAGHGVELHRRLRLEQLDHLRPGVDVGLDQLAARACPRDSDMM